MSKISALFNFDKAQCANVLQNLGTNPIDSVEERRMRNYVRDLGRTREDIIDQFYKQASRDEQAARRVEQERILTKWLQDLREFTELQPHKTGSMVDYLSRWLDFQIGKAGEIKYSVDMMQNDIRGMLHTAGRIMSAQRIRRLQSFIQDVGKRVELSAKDMKAVGSAAIEIGSINRELNAVGNTTAAQVMNRRRYLEYEKLLDNLGFTADEIREVSNLGADVSTAFTEVATIARAFGTDITDLPNLGYLTRIFTDMGLMRLKDISRGDAVLDTQTIANMSLTTVFNNSRTTNEFAMEDLVAFAEITGIAQETVFQKGAGVLSQPVRLDELHIEAGAIPDLVMPRPGGNYVTVTAGDVSEGLTKSIDEILPSFKTNPSRGQLSNKQLLNLLESVHQQSGSKIDGFFIEIPNATGLGIIKKFIDLNNSLTAFDYRATVLPLIENPLYMVDYLRTRMTSQQIDELLVDSGILTKMPMASLEVFEYFNKKYAFGFTEPSDFINMNIEEVMQGYLNSLNHSTANSGMIMGMISHKGEAAGWSITRDHPDWIANPNKYANYVPLGNIRKSLENIGLSPAQIRELNRQYVHPRVAKQIEASIWLNTDPAAISQTAQIFNEIARLNNKISLLSSGLGYFTRNTLTNVIMAAGVGNNLLRVIPSIKKLERMFVEGLDWLPDKPFAYISTNKGEPPRWVSYKEFVTEFMNRHAANYTPQVIGDESRYTGGSLAQFLKERGAGFPDTFNNMWNYITARDESVGFQNIGLPERMMRVLKGSGMTVKTLLNETFAPLGFFTNFIELGVKLSTYESLARKPGLDLGQILTSAEHRQLDSFEELDRAMREAFVRPENAGIAEKWLGDVWQPFIRYVIQTPPMVMRMMIRRPHLFMSYGRWRALNNEIGQERDKLKAAGFQDWEMTEYPHYLWSDPKTGQVGLLMPANFDPISSTWAGGTELGNWAMRVAFGTPIGTPGQVRQMYRPDVQEKVTDFTQEFVKNAYGWWQTGYELSTGKDAFTNRPILEDDSSKRYSWNGIAAPSWALSILKRVPFLEMLDRVNPFGFAGVAPLKDANGKLILNEKGEPVEPGRLSVFGAERKPGADKKKYDLRTQSSVYQVLRLAGLNVRVVDYNRNLQSSFTDIDKTINVLSSEIDKASKDIMESQKRGGYSQPEMDRRIEVLRRHAINYGYLLIERQRLLHYMLEQEKFGGRTLPREYLREIQSTENQLLKTFKVMPMPLDDKLEEITKDVAEKLVQIERSRDSGSSR